LLTAPWTRTDTVCRAVHPADLLSAKGVWPGTAERIPFTEGIEGRLPAQRLADARGQGVHRAPEHISICCGNLDGFSNTAAAAAAAARGGMVKRVHTSGMLVGPMCGMQALAPS
jgi:hypothetical protein